MSQANGKMPTLSLRRAAIQTLGLLSLILSALLHTYKAIQTVGQLGDIGCFFQLCSILRKPSRLTTVELTLNAFFVHSKHKIVRCWGDERKDEMNIDFVYLNFEIFSWNMECT